MLGRLSQRFADKLVGFGIISESDIEIYVFGFYQIVMLLLNVVTTLILGVAFRLIVPCIILNIAYIVIRISAGGYHADSPVKCYIYSTLMIAVLLSVIKWIHIPNTVLASMLVISGIVIVILAPVETENNPLDEIEKKVYRKRSLIVLSLEILACIFLQIISKKWVVQIIVLGLFAECIMLIAGAIKNHLYIDHNSD